MWQRKAIYVSVLCSQIFLQARVKKPFFFQAQDSHYVISRVVKQLVKGNGFVFVSCYLYLHIERVFTVNPWMGAEALSGYIKYFRTLTVLNAVVNLYNTQIKARYSLLIVNTYIVLDSRAFDIYAYRFALQLSSKWSGCSWKKVICSYFSWFSL